jgi:hypothetical protein
MILRITTLCVQCGHIAYNVAVLERSVLGRARFVALMSVPPRPRAA